MKTIKLRIVVLITLIVISLIGLAQPLPGDQSIGGGGAFSNGNYIGPGGGPIGGTGCPIDGGLSILLVLAGSYGGKIIYNDFIKLKKD
jgi:hypothetical protein